MTATKRRHKHDPAWTVIHALRVCGCADTHIVADDTMLDVDTVTSTIQALTERDLVSRREGRMPGWKLTEAGKEEHARLLAEEMGDGTVHDAVHHLHEAFVPCNRTFKEVCTNWQLRDGAPNPHDDPAYDRGIVTALRSIHSELGDALDVAGRTVVGFRAYPPRFSAALERLEHGDADAFARPLSGSYHDVWMELHQDLILRLGLQRGDDDA
jgi:DNA-binding MarR family transcriptional regulator